jgi:hypothetical protein
MPETAPLFPVFSRLRRNHALEHATLNLLAEQHTHQGLVGYSDPWGIWLVGNIPTPALEAAAHQALDRLRQGDGYLALHPNCGTNLVTSGVMAGLAGALGMAGAGKRARQKLERLPLVALLATIALVLSKPLGLWVQQHFTTHGDPQGLEIVSITPQPRGGVMAHRIRTRG